MYKIIIYFLYQKINFLKEKEIKLSLTYLMILKIIYQNLLIQQILFMNILKTYI